MKIVFPSVKFCISLMVISLSWMSCNSQPLRETEKINDGSAGIQWVSFEDAVKLSQKNPKKIFIDVYTNWCGWCKKMDKTTFMEDTIVNYLNRNYYAVKLNAETKDTIRFRDQQFIYQPEYKANELAISLLNGKMGYPSYVFLDENFSMITPPVQSYLTREDLSPLLVFFGENIYKSKTWEEYSGVKK